MLIKDLIKDLQKLEREFPSHEVMTRDGYVVDRVEKTNNGIELVMREQEPRFVKLSFMAVRR